MLHKVTDCLCIIVQTVEKTSFCSKKSHQITQLEVKIPIENGTLKWDQGCENLLFYLSKVKPKTNPSKESLDILYHKTKTIMLTSWIK